MTVLGGLGGAAASRSQATRRSRRIGAQRIGLDATLRSGLSGTSVAAVGLDAGIDRRLKGTASLEGIEASLNGNISRLEASIGLDAGLASQGGFANGYSHMIEMAYADPLATAATVNLLLRFEINSVGIRTMANGGFMVDPNAVDIRLEDLDGNLLPFDRVSYDAIAGRLVGSVRLAAQAVDQVRRLRLYFGRSGATDLASRSGVSVDCAARWALPDLVDRVTPTRSLGLVAGRGANLPVQSGERAIFTGLEVLKLDDASFLDGLTAFSVQADVSVNAALDGTDRGILTVGALTGEYGSSPIVLGKLAQSASASDTDIWHFKVRDDTAGQNSFYVSRQGQALGGFDGAVTGVAASGTNARFFLNGFTLEELGSAAFSGDIDVPAAAPLYIGFNGGQADEVSGLAWVGEIGEVRFRAAALTANHAGVEGRNLEDAEHNVTHSEPRRVTGQPRPLAIGELFDFDLDTAVEVDPLANAIQATGPAISALGTPANGTATVLGSGLVRYTPNTGFAGIDRVRYTLQSSGATSSAYLWLRANTSGGQAAPVFALPPVAGVSRSVANDTQLTSALSASSPGDEIVMTGTGFSASRTIATDGLIIRASGNLAATVSGRWTMTGAGSYLYGIDFRGNNRWISIRNSDTRVYYCRFRDNNPDDTGAVQRLIDIRGRRAVFGACEFTNCNTTALYFRIISGADGYDGVVERCYFHDVTYVNSSAALVACESDGTSLWVNGINGGPLRYQNTTVRSCLFLRVNTKGKTTNREMLMSKANGSKFINNTVIECQGFVNSRYTFDTTFDGNYIESSFGLLTQGDGNVVTNNMLVSCERGLWALGGTGTMDDIREKKIATGKWIHPAVRKSMFAHNVTVDTAFVLGRPNSSDSTFFVTDIDVQAHTGAISYGTLADIPNIRVSSTSAIQKRTPIKLSAPDVGLNYAPPAS